MNLKVWLTLYWSSLLWTHFFWSMHRSKEQKTERFTFLPEEYFYMFTISFYKLITISPCWREWLFVWKKKTLKFLYSRMLYAKFGWNWPNSFEERIFKYFQYNFTFSLLPSFEKACPFIWANLNLLHSRMFCIKFGWNWSSCSELEDFKIFFDIILLFCYYFPLEKGVALNLNKL